MKHLGFYIREAGRNIARGGVLTAAAVLAVTFASLIVGVFATAYVNLRAVYEEARRDVYIDVYLKDDVGEEKAQSLGVHLRRLNLVTRADYISREVAAKEFVGFFPDDKDLLAVAGENPLPASYRVFLATEATAADCERLVKEINAMDGVEEAVYGQEWLANLDEAASVVGLVGAAVGIILGATAVLVVISTIGLTVYARRDTISIMKVVGATDFFVQAPFVVEGLLIGFVGSALALVALRAGMAFLSQAELSIRFLPPTYVAAGLAAAGYGSAFGSWIAVRRFLRV